MIPENQRKNQKRIKRKIGPTVKLHKKIIQVIILIPKDLVKKEERKKRKGNLEMIQIGIVHLKIIDIPLQEVDETLTKIILWTEILAQEI